MPVGVAKDIYKKMYWDAVQADKMPLKLRYALFDAAVNSGVTQAIKWLQRAVNVSDDGILGPKTLAAVISQDQSKVFDSMVAQRLKFMASLSNWPAFGRGWTRRIAAILEES